MENFFAKPEYQEEPISLQVTQTIDEFESATWRQPAGVVPWAPPIPNWNTWSGCNIDEGPLAHVWLLLFCYFNVDSIFKHKLCF